MSIIRKLKGEEEFSSFVDIVVNAYPGTTDPSVPSKEQLVQSFLTKQVEDPAVDYYGLFRDGKLIGGMRLHYYQMNLFSKWVEIGGVGLVAVDLLHKKEKAAKELIDYFLQNNLNRGVHFTALYPFRPDFYKKMGYGYGPRMYQYSINPGNFPRTAEKGTLLYLNDGEKKRLNDCYERVAEKSHGLFRKTSSEWDALFKNPQNRIVGVEENGEIRGYIVFSFRKDNNGSFLINDLVLREFVYETPDALNKLCTFLNSQADQVNRIEWNTQDAHLHFLLHDSRNGSNRLLPSVYHEDALSGVGLMYRILDVKQFLLDLHHRNFNGQTITFKLTVEDTFLPSNQQELIITSTNGSIELKDVGPYEVEIKMDISNLSSLLMGVVSFQELFTLGQIVLSDPTFSDGLNAFFYVFERPKCTTAF